MRLGGILKLCGGCLRRGCEWEIWKMKVVSARLNARENLAWGCREAAGMALRGVKIMVCEV
jgi:hypothetical protein